MGRLGLTLPRMQHTNALRRRLCAVAGMLACWVLLLCGMHPHLGGCVGGQVAQLAGAPPPPREVIIEVPVKQGYVVTNPDGCALVC